MLKHQQDSTDANSLHSIDSGMLIDSVNIEELYNELQQMKDDLQEKDKEIQRAKDLRDKTDREIHELTASLFQSAHSMVDQAKQAQVHAEDKFHHSNLIIDALTLENTQLKKTVHELKHILNTCRSSSSRSAKHSNIDHFLLREYSSWEEQTSLERDSSLFMHRVYYEDILPCLTFPNVELSSKILSAIERNTLIMEVCSTKENIKNCSLMGELCPCDFRIQIDEWYPLCHLARNRIASVCNFFTFLRHVQSGLVKTDLQTRFTKVTELRQQMAFARLGFF